MAHRAEARDGWCNPSVRHGIAGAILNSGWRPLAQWVKDKDVRNQIDGRDFERAQQVPQGEDFESPSNPFTLNSASALPSCRS